MSYRYFDIPTQREVQCWEPIKRCYIAPDPIIEDSFYRELAYICEETNEGIWLYDPVNFTKTMNAVENLVDVEVDVNINHLEYNRHEINLYRNFFFRFTSISCLNDFFQYVNDVLKDYQKERSNIHLYVDTQMFRYRNFLRNKKYLRYFWSTLQSMNFDILELNDIADHRKNKRFHTHGRIVNDFFGTKRTMPSWTVEDGHMNIDTFFINSFDFRYAKFRNEMIEQGFNYY